MLCITLIPSSSSTAWHSSFGCVINNIVASIRYVQRKWNISTRQIHNLVIWPLGIDLKAKKAEKVSSTVPTGQASQKAKSTLVCVMVASSVGSRGALRIMTRMKSCDGDVRRDVGKCIFVSVSEGTVK